MAFLMADSFQHYATADITKKYTQIYSAPSTAPTINATGSRRAGQSLRWVMGNQNAQPVAIVLPASGATFVCGLAFRSGSAFGGLRSPGSCSVNVGTGSSLSMPLIFCRQGGATQFVLFITTTGTISVYRGDGAALLGTTTNALNVNTYAYIEVKTLIHPSAGTVDVHVNGISWLSLTGLNTRATANATWDEFAVTGLAYSSVGSTNDVCDLYVIDGSGSTTNDFLGDTRVDALMPNAAGAETNWTPLASTNVSQISETLIDGDTSYNSATTAATKDTYKTATQPVTGADIFAIQLCMGARKTDAGAAGLKAIARIAGTDYLGSELGVPSGYSFLRQVWDRRPSDTSNWVDSDIGPTATQFGIDKST